jgi:hypothetical protein
MIELFLAALALAATGATVWAVRKRKMSQPVPALPPPARSADKGELKPGDVIFHLGADYLVEGVAILREGGRSVLVVARMTDEGNERFLVVDPEGSPRCVLALRHQHGSAGHAVPNMILHEGMELRLSARAAVRIFCQGDFGLPKDAACELGRYQGPGERSAAMLLVEGMELLVVGRSVAEVGLELLQGDRSRSPEA